MEMAEIGATQKGGVCRLTLTDLDKESRDLFVQWCREAACAITIDKTLGDELNRIGYVGDADAGGGPVHAFFELHIERIILLAKREPSTHDPKRTFMTFTVDFRQCALR